jgi:CheY-like chemotaxis protein
LTGSSVQPTRGVLVVDDEAAIRAMLRSGLHLFGLPVWSAGSGPEALAVYREHAGAIGAALLDVLLPGQDGPQTLQALRALDPKLPCCFMSGHTGRYTEEDLLALGAARVFRKPFHLDDLAYTLRQLVGVPERRREPRHNASAGPVSVQGGPGYLRDRSAGGLGLWLAAPVAVGTVLNVRLDPASEAEREWPAEVRHCRADAAGWIVGCQLVARGQGLANQT